MFSRDSNYLYARKKDIVFSTFNVTTELFDGLGTTSYSFIGKKNFEYVRNKLGIPYKEGFKFIGWSVKSPNDGLEIAKDDLLVNSDLKVYAIFE